MPPLVTLNVAGPEATLMCCGVQPESISVSAICLEPFLALVELPQAASAVVAAVAATIAIVCSDHAVFARPVA